MSAGEVGSRDEVAARASGLADSVLSVAADAGDAALQRSAAEMFAFASCIGSTGFAAALVRNLVSATAETSFAPRYCLSNLTGLQDRVHLIIKDCWSSTVCWSLRTCMPASFGVWSC